MFLFRFMMCSVEIAIRRACEKEEMRNIFCHLVDNYIGEERKRNAEKDYVKSAVESAQEVVAPEREV